MQRSMDIAMNKRSRFRLYRICLCCAAMVAVLSTQAHAEGSSELFLPYRSYTYYEYGGMNQVVDMPAPFYPESFINYSTIGMGMVSPQDMVIDRNGNFVIIDAGLNQILILDPSYQVLNTLGPRFLTEDGEEVTLNAPSGIAVTDDGMIYVADTGNARIVVLSPEGKVSQILTAPVVDTFSKDYKYTPIKIAVDSTKRIYVVSRTDNMGIIELDQLGNFVGYIGSNKAIIDPIELLWKKLFYSKEQNAKSIQAIPVEYTNLSLDDRGFIYAVSSAKLESTPVKRLNPSGKDVMRREGVGNAVVGDLAWKISDASVMVDIAGAGNEAFFTLDNSKGRIFCYNSDGYMLYAFGALGTQFGTFTTPVAIEYSNDKLYVLDSSLQGFTVFDMTAYGKAIMEGDRLYYLGQYDESIRYWEDVLRRNSNYELAYAQIGKVLLREGDYEKAMEYFKLGNMRGDKILQESGYNKALSEYRKQYMGEHLGLFLSIISAAALLIAAAALWKKYGRKSGKKNEPKAWEGEE